MPFFGLGIAAAIIYLATLIPHPDLNHNLYTAEMWLPNLTPYNEATNTPTYGSPGCLAVNIQGGPGPFTQCMSKLTIPNLTASACLAQKRIADGYTNELGQVSNLCEKQS